MEEPTRMAAGMETAELNIAVMKARELVVMLRSVRALANNLAAELEALPICQILDGDEGMAGTTDGQQMITGAAAGLAEEGGTFGFGIR